MLAALLGWAQGTFASKIELADGAIKVTREVDGGLQTVTLKMPAIVTTDLRLNQPRYASLPNIMKAKKKPIDTKTAADFGVDTTPRLEVVETREPPKRQAGVKVASVAELLDKLKTEAGVLSMTALVLAEHDNQHLNEATAKTVAAAAKLGGDVHVLVAGKGAAASPRRRRSSPASRRCCSPSRDALAHGLAEPLAALIVEHRRPL